MSTEAGLYGELAKYYDLLHAGKTYKEESQLLLELIPRYKKNSGNQLLDVGCGTGKHLDYLMQSFQCFGVDLNEKMLQIAKVNHPNVEFIQSSMIDMRLNQQFDILTCLASSISYVKTYENLAKTWESFVLHLNPGGVAIIQPWFNQKNYDVSFPSAVIYQDGNTKIAKMHTSVIKDGVNIFDQHYLISTNGEKVEYIRDHHELALFEPEKMLDIMRSVGLTAYFLDKESIGTNNLFKHGLYIGIKS